MGGSGSGLRAYGKTKVEECFRVDANDFAKGGYFKPGQCWCSIQWTRGGQETGSCSFYIKIDDHHTVCVFHFNGRQVPVSLSFYVPGFGGRRYLFLCPVCLRRMRTLHFKNAEIGCRMCHNLTYRSCNKSHCSDNLYKLLAAETGYSWKEVKEMMEWEEKEETERPRGRPRKINQGGSEE